MKRLCTLLLFLFSLTAQAQLKPGFDINEYLELMRVSRQQFGDTLKGDFTPRPQQFHKIYQSPEGPL
ncbi:MAG TPA: hypothetical protein VFE54_00115, partial [Mucilaginibacter sp.]|nr:hypothetical protein [Mucilaginibacter sp.]